MKQCRRSPLGNKEAKETCRCGPNVPHSLFSISRRELPPGKVKHWLPCTARSTGCHSPLIQPKLTAGMPTSRRDLESTCVDVRNPFPRMIRVKSLGCRSCMVFKEQGLAFVLAASGSGSCCSLLRMATPSLCLFPTLCRGTSITI